MMYFCTFKKYIKLYLKIFLKYFKLNNTIFYLYYI